MVYAKGGGALWSLGLSKGNRDNIETGALPTLESVSPIEARDRVQDYAELSGFIAEFQLVSSGVESNPATSHPNSTEATCYALSPEHCCKKGGGIMPPTIRKWLCPRLDGICHIQNQLCPILTLNSCNVETMLQSNCNMYDRPVKPSRVR